MIKRLVMLFLEFGAAIAGNLVAGWVQGDLWADKFTLNRITGTVIGAVVMLSILAWSESERALHWTWRWHKFWYLVETQENAALRRWKSSFARLDIAARSRGLFRTEVIIDGERKDLIDALHDSITAPGRESRRLLLLGEPGSGKTTALERLTLSLARESVWKLGFNSRLPVLVQLGDFQEGVLFEQLKNVIRHGTKGGSGKVLAAGLETLLEKGQLVLLLDALDEALGERREQVLAQIVSLLKSQSYRNVPAIITCRTREDPSGRLDTLEVFEVENLKDESVREMIQIYWESGEQAEKVEGELKKLGLLEAQGIGRNPFWLGLILQSGVFAGNKGEILNKAVGFLLNREWNKPNSDRSWEKRLPKEEQLSETMRGLAWLAFQMSSQSQVSLDVNAALSELRQWPGRRVYTNELRAQDILALGRDALLLNYEMGTSAARIQPLRFRHRLLQEFLTAWALQSQKELLTQELIDRFIADLGWKETFLMLGGLEPDHKSLVINILGSHPDIHRLLVAVGLLQSINKLNEDVAQELTLGLAECLRGEFTAESRRAIADMMRAAPQVFTGVLLFLLHRFNHEVKIKTVGILKTLRNQGSANVLVSTLGDADIADQAVEALVSIGEPAVPPLIGALLHGGWDSSFEDLVICRWDWLIRLKAADALMRIGRPAVLPLLYWLEADNSCEIVKVLGRLKDERALDPLIKVLSSEKVPPDRKACAAKALGDLADNRALDALTLALTNQDWEVRRTAVNAIAKLNDQRAVAPLLKLLNDNNGEVLKSAAQAIGKLGDKSVIGPLLVTLKDPLNNADIRQSIVDALCSLGHNAVGPLTRLVHDDNSFLQAYALEALVKIADPNSTDILIALFGTKNRSVLLRVVKALEKIGDAGVLPHLHRYLEETLQNACDDTEVIEMLTRAIEKIKKSSDKGT